MYRISQLAAKFGLSRSTLLYYDQEGLLSPSGRSEAGYRLYSDGDLERLAAIVSFRKAGLSVEETRALLASGEGEQSVIRRRLDAIGEQIRALQAQQHLLARMLRVQSGEELPESVDKETWVAMLRAAGMDDEAMETWHAEFERRAPQAHHSFLLSLGIPEQEARAIREWSAAAGTATPAKPRRNFPRER
ncbi:MerR family transcriptional regulator [Geomonas sp. Red69]|uniref:MerR family transcriptional regulator n=1 Tax=Geomonas diazotrophica TaxID=2843197 RepID=UPI001C0F3D47|nr:MerR family transcriptional regulator [Geomonas diazotrophica]MBU5638565.1 MerR family transcriptional regulator [Geomonas diazotrophica]